MSIGHVGVAADITVLQLPDGIRLPAADFKDHDLWATFDVTRHSAPGVALDPFGVGRSQPVVGSHPARPATSVDTSLPRSGYSGLPQRWEFLAFGWRAVAVAPRRVVASDAAQAWFATTVAVFKYRGTVRAEWPLSELLRVAAPPAPAKMVGVPQAQPATAANPEEPERGQIFKLPVRLQENLSFGVEITSQDALAHHALRITLAHCGVRMSVRIFLAGLLKEPVW